MFVQTQLHLFFKIITISPWSMIVWENLLLRRTVCGDIDWHWHHQSQLAWAWWWIRSGCRNVSQRHHKHSFSGLHSPGQSYFTNLWYHDSWVQTFYNITTGLNFNFHLRPTFTQKALRTAVAVYEFCVTRNCFWAGFLWKSVSFRVILLKIVHKHAGIYSSIIEAVVSRNYFVTVLAKHIFFHSYFVQYVCCQRYLAVEDAVWLSQRKILSVFVSEELVLWSKKKNSSVPPLKSLYFHWTAICSTSIVFTPRSLFLLFVLLFSGLIVDDLTTAATSPKKNGDLMNLL